MKKEKFRDLKLMKKTEASRRKMENSLLRRKSVKKRLLLGCLMAVMSMSSLCWAGHAKAEPAAANPGVFTGATQYQNMRAALDSIADILNGTGVKYCDARISPLVRTEEGYEVPLEIGFLAGESKLVPVLEKMSAFSFADARLVASSLNISVTADTLEAGQPLLSANVRQNVMCGACAKESANRCLKRNRQYIHALTRLLEITTFKPQITKQVLGGGVGPGKTWITNLRIDNDNHFQITGYALDVKEVTRLGNDLLGSGAFLEVFISEMNKNTYEKVPVWRFALLARVN